MKKAVVCLTLLALMLTLTGCTKKVESIVFSQPSIEIKIEETVALSVLILPEDATETVTWSSANPAVASVDGNGVVTGLSAGTTAVVVTAESGVFATCAVTVLEKPAYDRLSAEAREFVDLFREEMDAFKNPDSVQIKGISLQTDVDINGVSRDFWYIKITAHNSYGANVTSCYSLETTGYLGITTDYATDIIYEVYYDATFALNQELDLINEALHS